MIKINRNTGEVTGTIDTNKAWEIVVGVYAKLLEEHAQLPKEEEKENV